MFTRISLAALATATLLVSVANADHRWRTQRYIVDPLDIITSAIDPSYDDAPSWIEDENEDNEPTLRDMRERRKRWARQDDELWWLEDDADEDDQSEPKPVKKKASVAKKPLVNAALPPKPKVKPEAKVASMVAVKTKPAMAKVTPEQSPKVQTISVTPKANIVPKVAAGDKKASLAATKLSGKTVGCTGGAAVVTGLGFAEVRPRICTGDTYAYIASKSDGNYAIKLKAATGEVVDVAKLP